MKGGRLATAAFLLCVPLLGQGTYREPAPRSTARLATPAPEPSYFVTAGGGDQAPGRGAAFTYWSVSRYLGQQNWATIITEYSISGNQVVTCPLAGISHVALSAGSLSAGLVGAGGACSGSVSGSSGAASAQGFAVVHLGGAWSLIATARKTFTNEGTNAVRVTLGVGYAK